MRYAMCAILIVSVFFEISKPIYAEGRSPEVCREFVLDMLSRFAMPGKDATLRIATQASAKDPQTLNFQAQTIPDAYLVALEKDSNLPPETYMTDAVKRELEKAPFEPIGSVRCPRNAQDEKQKNIFKADLESVLKRTYQYVDKNRITPVLKKFLVQFHTVFDPEYRQIQIEVQQKYSASHSIDYGLWIHERYTDESFGILRITCGASAILWDTHDKSKESIEKELERAAIQRPIMLEITIKTTGRPKKDIELDIAKGAAELNKKMMKQIKLILLGGNPTEI